MHFYVKLVLPSRSEVILTREGNRVRIGLDTAQLLSPEDLQALASALQGAATMITATK